MKIGKRLCILALLIGIRTVLPPVYSDERGAGLRRTPPPRDLIPMSPPQMDPLYQKHVAYAKAVFGSGWESHVADIQAKWNEEVGTAPENLKTIAGFNNFFNFVRSVDNEMGIDLAAVDLQLKDLYETVDKQLKKESINPGKLSPQELGNKAEALLVRYNHYRKHFAAVKEYLMTLKGNSLLGLKQKLEQAISAYAIDLTPVSSIKEDSLDLKWKWARYAFGIEARPLYIDNIRERFPDLESVEEYWQSFEDSYSETKSLLDDIFKRISFRYPKADGSYGFVSFVNFDGWSPQPFSNGQGGCGAIDTLSVHFLKEP